MKSTLFLSLLALLNLSHASDWSDTMDLNENSIFAFESESKLFGYKQNGKVVIKPKFEEACNFHCGYANAKLNGHWGIITTKGKWKIKPQYDFTSSVIQDNFIVYQDSIFFLCNVSGQKKELGRFFKTDYVTYISLLKTSHDPDKNLILRILEMNDPLNSHGRHKDPTATYEILSRCMVRLYWSTKWLLSGGLEK